MATSYTAGRRLFSTKATPDHQNLLYHLMPIGNNFASPDCARPRVSTTRNGYSRARVCNATAGSLAQGNSRRNEKGKKGKNAIPGVFGGHNAHRTHPEPLREGAACSPPLVVSQLGEIYSRTGGLTSIGRTQRQVEAQFGFQLARLAILAD